jgi:hypothetical protein
VAEVSDPEEGVGAWAVAAAELPGKTGHVNFDGIKTRYILLTNAQTKTRIFRSGTNYLCKDRFLS